MRSAAQAAADATSLRSVAAAIGMSAPGLQHFLNGGSPLRPTLRKLVKWYAGHVRTAGKNSDDELRAVVALLLTYFPPQQQEQAGSEVMQVIARYAPQRLAGSEGAP